MMLAERHGCKKRRQESGRWGRRRRGRVKRERRLLGRRMIIEVLGGLSLWMGSGDSLDVGVARM
jgi:hypothetical protein